MILNSTFATIRRNFTIQTRAYPVGFFLGKLFTCFFAVLSSYFVYKIVFNGRVSDEFVRYAGVSDYMSYAILGCFIYLFVVGTFLNVSRSFITEMREGTLDCLLISPVNQIGYLTGNMLEQTMITTGELIAAAIISIPFGLKLTNINISSTILCIIASLFAFFGMSIILAAIMVYYKDTYLSQNTVFSIIYLVCGILFPIQYLPGWVQGISQAIPVTYSLKILRNSVLAGMDITSQANDFLSLSILGIIYFLIGLTLIKKIIKKAPERQFI